MNIHYVPSKKLKCQRILFLAACLLTSPSFAKESETQELTYESFINLIIKQHPENEISSRLLLKAKETTKRSGILSDPQLTVGHEKNKLSSRFQPKESDSMMPSDATKNDNSPEWNISLSQNFPWPGTLAAEEKVAKIQENKMTADVNRMDLERRFAATELFLRMVRVSKLIDVQKSNLKVVESVKHFAHAKFKQGIGSHYEFLQTHSESGVLKANIAALETDFRNLKRHAIILINDPSLKDINDLKLKLEWPQSFTATKEQPDFVREKLIYERDGWIARNDAAYKRSMPSFMASGMVMQQEESGMRMYGAMIGVSVPLYSNGQRGSLTRENDLAQNQATSELSWHDIQKNLALSQAEERIAQIEANVASLKNEIIPPVQEHTEAATAQFSQGTADIATIIEGRRMLLNLQVTEVLTSESLALAKLSVDKIKAGLIDMELDQEVPQLSVTSGGSMTSSMGAGGASMSNMTKSKRKISKMNSSGANSGTLNGSNTEEEMPQSSSSGMGM